MEGALLNPLQHGRELREVLRPLQDRLRGAHQGRDGAERVVDLVTDDADDLLEAGDLVPIDLLRDAPDRDQCLAAIEVSPREVKGLAPSRTRDAEELVSLGQERLPQRRRRPLDHRQEVLSLDGHPLEEELAR